MENNQTTETQTQTPQGPTKTCKHCKSIIPKGAKICPLCRKKQGGIVKWVIIAVIVIIVIAALGGGGNDTSTNADATTSSNDNTTTSTTVEKKEAEDNIEYTAYMVDDMMNDLNSNPMNAATTYKDKYVEITGKLNVIDASGKYISLVSTSDEYAILGVQCYINDDTQKSKVSEMSMGDTVTLKGKVTDVGEVLGYSLNIDEIE